MTGSERLPPASIAARRSRAPASPPRPVSERFYPAVDVVEDHDALAAVLAATRALLTAARPEQVAGIVKTLVHDLGGGLVPARLADGHALPMDVALGFGEPLLPWAEPVSVAAMRLSSVLPGFLQDAHGVLHRLHGEQRRTEEADTDLLTGLLSRRAWMRRLGSAESGDALCLIDLDHFKTINDEAGHAAGDEVLRTVGALLLRMPVSGFLRPLRRRRARLPRPADVGHTHGRADRGDSSRMGAGPAAVRRLGRAVCGRLRDRSRGWSGGPARRGRRPLPGQGRGA